MSTSKSEIDSFFTDGKIRIDKIRTLDNKNYKIEWEIKIIGGKFYARKFIDGKVKSKIKEVTKEWIKERGGNLWENQAYQAWNLNAV